jgi:hypothetical protein
MKSFKGLEKNDGKKIINQTIAKLSIEIPTKQAIVLDGANRCTTKELIKHGWSQNKILIPNFSDDYKTIKKHHKQAFNISLNELLTTHNLSKNSVSCAYLDYMCSWNGNDNVTPKQDIIKLFSQNIMTHKSVFAITICLRSREKNTTPFINLDVLKCISMTQQIMYYHGYQPELIPMGGNYRNGGNMCSLIWRLR